MVIQSETPCHCFQHVAGVRSRASAGFTCTRPIFVEHQKDSDLVRNDCLRHHLLRFLLDLDVHREAGRLRAVHRSVSLPGLSGPFDSHFVSIHVLFPKAPHTQWCFLSGISCALGFVMDVSESYGHCYSAEESPSCRCLSSVRSWGKPHLELLRLL